MPFQRVTAFLVPRSDKRICVCGEMLESVSLPGATTTVICGSAAKSLLSQVPEREQLSFLRRYLCVVDQGCHVHRDFAPHLLCDSRKDVCAEYADLEGFARSLQGTIEVFRGPGLRRSSKALTPVTGVVGLILILPPEHAEIQYVAGGTSYRLNEGAMTCTPKPHNQSPFRFCSWLSFCDFSEDSYDVSYCSLGLYQSFLARGSGLSHRHDFAVAAHLDPRYPSLRIKR